MGPKRREWPILAQRRQRNAGFFGDDIHAMLLLRKASDATLCGNQNFFNFHFRHQFSIWEPIASIRQSRLANLQKCTPPKSNHKFLKPVISDLAKKLIIKDVRNYINIHFYLIMHTYLYHFLSIYLGKYCIF